MGDQPRPQHRREPEAAGRDRQERQVSEGLGPPALRDLPPQLRLQPRRPCRARTQDPQDDQARPWPPWPTTPTCHLLRESQKMRQEWRRWTNFFQELKFSPVLHFVLYLFSFLADNLSPKLILLQVSKQI